MEHPLQYETVWFDKYKFDDAEKHWQESLVKKQEIAVVPDVTDIIVPMQYETVWFDKYKYDDAEKTWQEYLTKQKMISNETPCKRSLIDEIAHARQQIKKSLQSSDFSPVPSFTNTSDMYSHFQKLEAENSKIKNLVQDMLSMVTKLEARISILEGQQLNVHE